MIPQLEIIEEADCLGQLFCSVHVQKVSSRLDFCFALIGICGSTALVLSYFGNSNFSWFLEFSALHLKFRLLRDTSATICKSTRCHSKFQQYEEPQAKGELCKFHESAAHLLSAFCSRRPKAKKSNQSLQRWSPMVWFEVPATGYRNPRQPVLISRFQISTKKTHGLVCSQEEKNAKEEIATVAIAASPARKLKISYTAIHKSYFSSLSSYLRTTH